MNDNSRKRRRTSLTDEPLFIKDFLSNGTNLNEFCGWTFLWTACNCPSEYYRFFTPVNLNGRPGAFLATKHGCLHFGFIDCSFNQSSHGEQSELDDLDHADRKRMRKVERTNRFRSNGCHKKKLGLRLVPQEYIDKQIVKSNPVLDIVSIEQRLAKLKEPVVITKSLSQVVEEKRLLLNRRKFDTAQSKRVDTSLIEKMLLQKIQKISNSSRVEHDLEYQPSFSTNPIIAPFLYLFKSPPPPTTPTNIRRIYFYTDQSSTVSSIASWLNPWSWFAPEPTNIYEHFNFDVQSILPATNHMHKNGVYQNTFQEYRSYRDVEIDLKALDALTNKYPDLTVGDHTVQLLVTFLYTEFGMANFSSRELATNTVIYYCQNLQSEQNYRAAAGIKRIIPLY